MTISQDEKGPTKGIKRRAWNSNLAFSAAIHGAIILLCLDFVGHTAAAKREVVTIVLDAQTSVPPGPHCEAPPRNPEPKPAEPAAAQKRPATASPRVLRQENMQPKAVPVETLINPPTQVTVPIETLINPATQIAVPVETLINRQSQVAAAAEAPAAIQTPSAPATQAELPSAGHTPNRESAQTGNPGSNRVAADQAGTGYMREHFFYIRDLITKNLGYPPAARKFGWKGSLTVTFVICEGGRVENIRVVKSSGYKILDDNAVNTIKSIQPFPRPPAKAEIVIPIEYRFE